MKRTGRRIPATGRDTGIRIPSGGLQVLWRARWTLMAEGGEIHWRRTPGEVRPALAPQTLPPVLALLRGVRGLTPRVPPLGSYRRLR
jgi:hypothetical protein